VIFSNSADWWAGRPTARRRQLRAVAEGGSLRVRVRIWSFGVGDRPWSEDQRWCWGVGETTALPVGVVEEAGWVGSAAGARNRWREGRTNPVAVGSWAADPVAEAPSSREGTGWRRGQATREVRKGGIEGEGRLVGGGVVVRSPPAMGGGGGRRWTGGQGATSEGRKTTAEEDDSCVASVGLAARW
jgi:hypothetical protein